jgi:hypothetical protein
MYLFHLSPSRKTMSDLTATQINELPTASSHGSIPNIHDLMRRSTLPEHHLSTPTSGVTAA